MATASHSRTSSFLTTSSYAIVDDTSPAVSPGVHFSPLPPSGDDSDEDFVLLGSPPVSSHATFPSKSSTPVPDKVRDEGTPRLTSHQFVTDTYTPSKSPAIDMSDAETDLSRRLRLLDIAVREAERVLSPTGSARTLPLGIHQLVPPVAALAASLPPIEKRPMDWTRTPTPSDDDSRTSSRNSPRYRTHPPTPSESPSPPSSPPGFVHHLPVKTVGVSSSGIKKKKKKKKAKGMKKIPMMTKTKEVTTKAEEEFTGISIDSYEEAVKSITWLLGNPEAIGEVLSTTEGKLRYYQALLIEFGVCAANNDGSDLEFDHDMPSSVTSAKQLLRNTVHIHVSDYIECRDDGYQALEQKMLPSKSALRKEVMDRKKNKKSIVHLVEIKQKGLNVLLAENVRWHR